MARVLLIAVSLSEASGGLRGQPLASMVSKIRGFFTSQGGTHESWLEDPWNAGENVTKPDPDYCPKPEEYDWFPCKTHWDESKNKGKGGWQSCKPPHSGQKCQSPIEGCKSFQVQYCQPYKGANCECPQFPPGKDTRPTGKPTTMSTSTTTTSTQYCPKPTDYDWYPCKTHKDKKGRWEHCVTPHSGVTCKSPIAGCPKMQVQFCPPAPNGAMCECPMFPPGEDHRSTYTTTTKSKRTTTKKPKKTTTTTTTEEPTTTESTTEPSTGPTTPTTTTPHPTSPAGLPDPSTPVGVYFLFPLAALMVCVCAIGVNIYRSRRARAQAPAAPSTESMLGQSMQPTGARTVN